MQADAPVLELLEVDISEACLLQGNGAVVVVEVVALAAAERRVGKRLWHHVGDALRTDAGDGEHRREYRYARLHILLAVGVECRHHLRILSAVRRGGPDDERHVYAVA